MVGSKARETVSWGQADPLIPLSTMPEESIHFENTRGERLAGTLHLPGGSPGAGVILAHCFTCSRHTTILRRCAQFLADAGLAALRFDFSGNGQSQGRFVEMSYTKHAGELLTAAEYLRGRAIRIRGLIGHSMGAALVLLAVGQLPEIKGVCTLAGRLGGLAPTEFLDPTQQHQLAVQGRVAFASRGRQLELTQAFFDDARGLDLSRAIAGLHCPLLVVHGDRDGIIPVAEAEKGRALNPQQATLHIVAGADHMFSRAADRDAVAARVAAWFQEQIGP